VGSLSTEALSIGGSEGVGGKSPTRHRLGWRAPPAPLIINYKTMKKTTNKPTPQPVSRPVSLSFSGGGSQAKSNDGRYWSKRKKTQWPNKPKRYKTQPPKKEVSNQAAGPGLKKTTQTKSKKAFHLDSRQAKHDRLKIYALGGLEEVGRNMTVFEYGKDIVILDMGNQFPDEDMHGIDYIIPNISSLQGKEKNIRAVIISHGHMDHIGAAPHLLPKLGNPLIIAAPMTAALLKRQLADHHEKFTPNISEIKSIKKSYKLGKFRVSFFQVTHSIKDAVGLILETPVGTIIHPGDWRYDLDPVEGPKTDMRHLAKWNKINKPSILMMESLGSTQVGHQGSEKEVYNNIKNIIKNAEGRVIFGTFSSMVERIGQVIQIAEKSGKKVVIDGFSMKANIEIGKAFGFIKHGKHTMIDISKVHDYPKNKIVVICSFFHSFIVYN